MRCNQHGTTGYCGNKNQPEWLVALINHNLAQPSIFADWPTQLFTNTGQLATAHHWSGGANTKLSLTWKLQLCLVLKCFLPPAHIIHELGIRIFSYPNRSNLMIPKMGWFTGGFYTSETAKHLWRCCAFFSSSSEITRSCAPDKNGGTWCKETQ